MPHKGAVTTDCNTHIQLAKHSITHWSQAGTLTDTYMLTSTENRIYFLVRLGSVSTAFYLKQDFTHIEQ